jgi:toxin HigB-1
MSIKIAKTAVDTGILKKYTIEYKDVVELTRSAEKDLRKLTRHLVILFNEWVKTVETMGYEYMKTLKGYRDHPLKGNRFGERSVSLTISYRVIYEVHKSQCLRIVEVKEVNKHEY